MLQWQLYQKLEVSLTVYRDMSVRLDNTQPWTNEEPVISSEKQFERLKVVYAPGPTHVPTNEFARDAAIFMSTIS